MPSRIILEGIAILLDVVCSSITVFEHLIFCGFSDSPKLVRGGFEIVKCYFAEFYCLSWTVAGDMRYAEVTHQGQGCWICFV